MMIKRITFLILILFSIASCTGSDHSSTPQAPQTRYSDFAVPSTYAELESYVTVVDVLQADYQTLLNVEERTFENTVVFFNDLYDRGWRVNLTLAFLEIVAPDDDMRALASQTRLQLSSWFFQLVTDSVLHHLILPFIENKDQYTGSDLTALESVEELLTDYGMGLDEDSLSALTALNIQTETLHQQITYLDTMGDPDGLIPGLFADLIKTQTASAQYMGYENFADYKLSEQMPGSAAVVDDFLVEASARLDVPFNALIEKLQAIKAEETGDPDATIYFNDRIYDYLDVYIEAEYGIADFMNKKLYEGVFNIDDILETLFSLAEDYFDIELVRAVPPGNVWDEDVQYYELRDKESGDILSSLYLDLYARAGKQDMGGSITTIQREYTDEEGLDVRPVYAWVMPIDKADDEDILVPVSDTLTMFHEFGHLLQRSLSDAVSNASVSVEYTEIFSQLFEQYFYEREVINSLLGDHSAWSDEEYEEWMNAIAASELNRKKTSLALYLYNLRLFTDYTDQDDVDVLAIQDEVFAEYYLSYLGLSINIPSIGYQIDFPSTYYAYAWSLGIALDVADYVRENGGLLNKENTEMLKKNFYTLEAPLDKDEHIRALLDRDWNMDAFYRYYGAE